MRRNNGKMYTTVARKQTAGETHLSRVIMLTVSSPNRYGPSASLEICDSEGLLSTMRNASIFCGVARSS
jgi:hypothetical protein